MKRLLPLALLLASCDPAPTGAGLPMGVDIRGIAPQDVNAVQITVLSNATAFLCSDLVKACLKSKVKPSDMVPITGEDGQQHTALRVKVDPEKLMAQGETIKIQVSAGTNYMVVAEVLAADARLLASGCEVAQELEEGDNAPLVIRALPLEPIPACDPRID